VFNGHHSPARLNAENTAHVATDDPDATDDSRTLSGTCQWSSQNLDVGSTGGKV